MPNRRMSMRLATIVEASPPSRSPKKPPRRMSLGVNIPVDQRPPRKAPKEADQCTSFNIGTMAKPLNPVTPASEWRRKSLDFGKSTMLQKTLHARRQSLPCRSREMKEIRTTAITNPTNDRAARRKGTSKGDQRIPSYARPTASSLRHRRT
ncbi:hypothetical protein B9G98_03176 [Wickerhamiella sorbophila]|uniref:Uncharacterized protein n=1 Tax=Wickerhamiella sorbophila TaxID=45607 RepID=A0A2T0FKN8_9ASCO|nr:hypothetical protein B9G98_03176 [Wickerhamiella sorbophila]PRT55556.1 hypothetical protein B9G98_03176 [Wickerhamiella sorbophila]